MVKEPQPKGSGSPGYDLVVALDFFKSAGEIASFTQGATIFAENERAGRFSLKRNKMYLVLEGQVNLVANGKFLGLLGPGEIFGEMAALNQAPRSANAVARTATRLISLDDRQFMNALQKKPEFALMMMGVIVGRLRNSLAQIKQEPTAKVDSSPSDSQVFEKKLLHELLDELGDDAKLHFDQGRMIMQEGQVGVLMYIILVGKVCITIKGKAIEKIGPGAVFGEMALVEKAPRLATAMAESDCELLAINRNNFLDLVKSKPQFGMSLLTAIGERARTTTSRI